jgi:hypothetical protein
MEEEENFMASQVATRKLSVASNGEGDDHDSPMHRKMSAAWLNSAENADDSRINTTEDNEGRVIKTDSSMLLIEEKDPT